MPSSRARPLEASSVRHEHLVRALLNKVEPWQILLAVTGVASLYGVGLAFTYLDLVYEQLGAAGAQPSLTQTELWPRSLLWSTFHLSGFAGILLSYYLASLGRENFRYFGVQVGLISIAALVAAGATDLAGGATFLILAVFSILAAGAGCVRRRLPRRVSAPATSNITGAEIAAGAGVLLAMMVFLGIAVLGNQVQTAADAIESDRRPTSYLLVLPVRRVNVTITEDRVAQALRVSVNTPLAATLLGQRDGRYTLLLKWDRSVVDMPIVAAVLTSRPS